MAFRLEDHTADVGVSATAADLGAGFAALADGMGAAMCESIPTDVGTRFEVSAIAESREALLFEYLDELIYQRDVRNVLPVDNRAVVSGTDDGWSLTGSARGVPLEAVTAREIKAVTYSEMRIEQTDEGWELYVVLDV